MSWLRNFLLDIMGSSSSSRFLFSGEFGGDIEDEDTPDEVLPGEIPPSEKRSSRARVGEALCWYGGDGGMEPGLWYNGVGIDKFIFVVALVVVLVQ